jgi:hypothetical protein
MNIVEAYTKFNNQNIILVSGFSGSKKTMAAKFIANIFKFKYSNLADFNYATSTFDVEENRIKLNDNTIILDWDNVYKSVDWNKFNRYVLDNMKDGIVISGFGFPANLLKFKPNFHIHIKISKQALLKNREEYLKKHGELHTEQTENTETDDTDTDTDIEAEDADTEVEEDTTTEDVENIEEPETTNTEDTEQSNQTGGIEISKNGDIKVSKIGGQSERQSINMDRDKYILNNITYPHYLKLVSESKIDKFINSTEMNDTQIKDEIFSYLINMIKTWLNEYSSQTQTKQTKQTDNIKNEGPVKTHYEGDAYYYDNVYFPDKKRKLYDFNDEGINYPKSYIKKYGAPDKSSSSSSSAEEDMLEFKNGKNKSKSKKKVSLSSSSTSDSDAIFLYTAPGNSNADDLDDESD